MHKFLNLHIYRWTLKCEKRISKFLWEKQNIGKKKIGNKETNKQWKYEIELTFNTDSERTKKLY